MGTPFISFLEPSKLEDYDRTLRHDQQPRPVSKVFLDAMSVREAVFVDEQKMPLEFEYDNDDPRSCHWVIYASVSRVVEPEVIDEATGLVIRSRRSETHSLPIGTMRIVPFPHPPHPKPDGWYEDYKLVERPGNGAKQAGGSTAAKDNNVTLDGSRDTEAKSTSSSTPSTSTLKPATGPAGADPGLGSGATTLAATPTPPPYAQDRATTLHDGQEPYMKVGRLAVLPAYRGRHIAGQLWTAARRWLEANPRYFDPSVTEKGMDALNAEQASEIPRWGGLVCAHAQEAVVKTYQRWGFQIDEGMGRWYEEGVPHVGMFTRLNTKHVPAQV
ncbi:gcn5-related n-acetyltransferase [Apiospora saccharicola]|uniref:Gcn5-related n-acetyltransferase n=1 Tax=Apiospora saccharicola TaxID=335842 RepID=A0ABR1W3Q6_9PEZI